MKMINPAMAEQVARKLHGILIPPPYQGHINPMINLALKLASYGITVTFIHFHHIHHKLFGTLGGADADPFSDARKSGLDIRYETVSDGFSLGFDRELHFEEYIRGLIEKIPNIIDELVKRKMGEFDSVSNWVNFLVYDTVHFWIPDIAQKYKIVNVSLWTEPALVFYLLCNLKLLRENGHFPCKDDLKEEMRYIPGISSINTRDLMTFLRESESQGVIALLISKSFDQVSKADFILHNTVEELESQVLSKLNEHQPNYAIGPLNLVETFSSSHLVRKSIWPEFDCKLWLSSKQPGSVLYVSFGSFIHLSKETIDEIAYGLLLSEVNFIWVLRTGISKDGYTLNLFGEMEKMNEKGMVIPWSNQIEVLSDPAVGGFLTHNGWNSTIESMWFGVPMICFPFMSDQVTNRKLVVEDWSIGLNLYDGKFLDRREVAEKIKSLFDNGETCSKLKKNAMQVKEMMRAAFHTGGSSQMNFDRFLENLKQKCSS